MIYWPRYFMAFALTLGMLSSTTQPSAAQTKVLTTCGTNVPGSYPVGSIGQPFTLQVDGTLCVNATVNASVAGFAPNGNYATLTSAGTSGSVALPSGAVVLFQNIGTTAVSCVLGVGSATATASKIVIQPASWFGVTVGSNTFGACIDQTGSTSNTVVLAGGTGLPTGAGGGSGGGGGGGAVTVADGADTAEGAVADAASAAGGAGTLSAKARLMTTQLGTLNTTLGTPMQATGGTVTANLGTISTAATAANQSTEISSLATIATNTGAAVPTVQSAGSASPTALISCDNHVFKHITTATDTLAVQGASAKTIYVCGWRARAAGVATWFLENTASTNANCSSSNTQITGVATEAANTGEVMNPAFWSGLKNTAANGLCINSTGTGGVDIDIWYTQF